MEGASFTPSGKEVVPVIDEKTKKEAYLDAKHNMTSRSLETSVEQAQRSVDVARTEYTFRESVLAGYRQAAKERGVKAPGA
jgi:hypothetical protein